MRILGILLERPFITTITEEIIYCVRPIRFTSWVPVEI